jgi:hypothetical protein
MSQNKRNYSESICTDNNNIVKSSKRICNENNSNENTTVNIDITDNTNKYYNNLAKTSAISIINSFNKISNISYPEIMKDKVEHIINSFVNNIAIADGIINFIQNTNNITTSIIKSHISNIENIAIDTSTELNNIINDIDAHNIEEKTNIDLKNARVEANRIMKRKKIIT